MPLTGKLKTWNDDRGFGFIAPTDGGREVFVHISAFPRGGARPTIGEPLTYELGAGKDGKPLAVRVYRQAPAKRPEYRRSPQPSSNRNSSLGGIVGVLLFVGLGAYGFKMFKARTPAPVPLAADTQATAVVPREVNPSFRCDGRTHCSQMTSCDEATFFLRNCPGPEMDGDDDGIPCERQWCTSPFAR